MKNGLEQKPCNFKFLSTFYAALSYLWLTVHFIEAKKSDTKMFLLFLHTYIYVKTDANTHTHILFVQGQFG